MKKFLISILVITMIGATSVGYVYAVDNLKITKEKKIDKQIDNRIPDKIDREVLEAPRVTMPRFKTVPPYRDIPRLSVTNLPTDICTPNITNTDEQTPEVTETPTNDQTPIVTDEKTPEVTETPVDEKTPEITEEETAPPTEITNDTGDGLPKTGEASDMLIVFIGAILIIGGIFVLKRQYRKNF